MIQRGANNKGQYFLALLGRELSKLAIGIRLCHSSVVNNLGML